MEYIMEKSYFVETYDAYHEFVRDDAYNWHAAGYEAGTLTAEDLRSEYSESIEFMTYEEANEAAGEAQNVYSIEELCDDMNEAMREYEE